MDVWFVSCARKREKIVEFYPKITKNRKSAKIDENSVFVKFLNFKSPQRVPQTSDRHDLGIENVPPDIIFRLKKESSQLDAWFAR